jgi:transcriptional regulator with XRE-family HTH domain
VNTFKQLWRKLAKSKKYREEFVAQQVKRGIPFQIRSLMKARGWKQEELAKRANLTQGVISRAMNPNYGNLTLNTLVRIAAGFDVAFIGHFVPFSELGRWFINLSEATNIPNFEQENAIAETAGTSVLLGVTRKPSLEESATRTNGNEKLELILEKKVPSSENIISIGGYDAALRGHASPRVSVC